MSRPTPVLLALALLAGAGNGNALRALQATTSPPDSIAPSMTALLPHDHWSRSALRRLATLGLLEPAAAWTTWPARHDHVLRLLRTATERAATTAHHAHNLTSALEQRLNAEFGVLRRSSIPAAATVGLIAGFRHGHLRAGNTIPSESGYEYTGPRPQHDDAWVGVLTHAFFATRWLSAGIGLDPADDDGPDAIALAYAALHTGPVDLWFGRRSLSFQAGSGGSVVLSGNGRFDGIGFDTPAGFRLPGFLGSLGTIRVTQMLARMARSGPIERPLFLAQRLSVAPSDRLVIAVNRAAIFGGKGNLSVTPWRVAWLLLGQTDVAGKDSDFENQVASVDMVVRPFPEKPALFYLEWGFDDAGAAVLRVPAILAGFTYAGIAAAPWALVGLEVVRFAGKCCGYPEWYWHGALPDGWTDGGEPIGHPLGGHGTELALSVAADLIARPASVETRLFVRDRGRENLFSPNRRGWSGGAALHASIGLIPGTRLDVDVDVETASSWSSLGGRIGWIYTF